MRPADSKPIQPAAPLQQPLKTAPLPSAAGGGMNRRGILTCIASGAVATVAAACLVAPETLAATASVAPPSADAELIEACEAMANWEHRFSGLHGERPMGHLKIANENARTAALAEMDSEGEALAFRIYDLRATTLDGHRARVRAMPNLGEIRTVSGVTYHEALILNAMVRDLSGGVG